MLHVKSEHARGSYLTFRPDIKILDCTVRDGGLINNHQFDDDFVRAVYETAVASGVDYMEFGYKGAKSIYPPDEYGPWKHCDEEYLRRIVGDNATSLKIGVMADAERSDYRTDILPKSESVIDLVRVATYIHQLPVALDMVHDAIEKGYEVAIQLMAVSVVPEHDLEEALRLFAESPAAAVYLVDSFGSLYSEQVRDLTLSYLKALEGTGKEVGIHAHNNQQLAYANTIEALILGASRLDATLNGMGRGAGNCPLELLIGFLKNPKFKLRPVLQCIQDHVLPLDGQMEWGALIPYMITGQLNQHPRAAIKWRQSDTPDDYVTFYDQVTEEE
jgi:4-hydroxy 2-oxovalerate aldolase